jgi:putative ABC transport system substrate-binding protein
LDRRRTVVALACLGGAAVFSNAFAQQSKIRRVGYLAARSRSTPSNPDPYYDAFVEGIRELGYFEGKNLALEWRFANDQYERLPALAAELVKARVEVIVSHSTPGTKAVQQATSTIPIVMHGNDPVGSGIVANLARPQGNVTGQSLTVADVTPKHLELLKTLLQQLSRVALLVNPLNASHSQILDSFRTAAQRARVRVVPISASRVEELEPAFATMTRERVEAFVVTSDSFFASHRREITQLALGKRLPSLVEFREAVMIGGLMSYALDLVAVYKHAALYVDKILKGAKPADLPIEQATKFELMINLKTARQLGLTVPKELLLRADRVIE